MRISQRPRRVLAHAAVGACVAAATVGGVALADKPAKPKDCAGTTGPVAGARAAKVAAGARRTVPDAISAAARRALDRLVAQGQIDRAQADAVMSEVQAGSVDPKSLVDRGTVTDAQMQAIATALAQVKRSFAG